MADKRMITRKVTDDDNFLALSASAQALYLHLSMAADDDGFCNQVSLSMFKAHASVNDLQALLTGRFIYQFDNGVIVIKHWRMANALRKDRYTPTAFQEELAMLKIKDNGAYTKEDWLPDGCQAVAKRLPEGCRSIDKNRLNKNSLVNNRLGECEGEGEVLYELLTKDGDIFPVYQSMIDYYSKLYPNIDVRQEFGAMQGWCEANDKNRKTFKGMKRFINGWLNRAKPKEKSFIEAAAELEKEGWEF